MSADDDQLARFLAWARPPWHADAACREHPELSWFPERGQSVDEPRAVCADCLVRVECAAAGLHPQEVGIWGGTTGRDRRRTRTELARTPHAAKGPAPHPAGCDTDPLDVDDQTLALT